MRICEQTERNRPFIVCFGGCDWWYHNRGLFCPQIMTRLAKRYRVLFVNSLGMRIPSFKRGQKTFPKIFRKLRSILLFLRKAENKMYVLSPVSLPVSSRLGRKFNAYFVFLQVKLVSVLLGFKKPVVYIGCPPALEVAKKLGQRHFMIYERTDLFEEMPGADRTYITSLDDELIKSAGLVLYVNKALWEHGIRKNRNSLLIGHGVDYERFAEAEKSKYVPDEIREIPRPIAGYFGDITEDVCDFDLLEYAAKKLTDISFVLVGPISSGVTKLKKYNNIYFLGQKPYEEIPHYGKMFDVAIMPWKNNRWVEFCNPVKTKEYLALGKPVVSMYYPEIDPYSDIVYVARDCDSFVSCILEAVKENDPAKTEERRERVRNETWDNKVAQIEAAMERGLSEEISTRQPEVPEVSR